MDVVTVALPMTAQKYLALPEQRWTDLVEGELVLAQPRIEHQAAAGRLFHTLTLWTGQAPGRGEATLPVDVELDDVNIYAPTSSGSTRRGARARAYAPSRCLTSRSRFARPRPVATTSARRRRATSANGLPELWLVDIGAAVVLVFRRSQPAGGTFDVSLELARGGALASPLLPGFARAVDELFAS